MTIIAVGDIMMGSDYPSNNLPPNRGRDLFSNVDSILNAADLTLGNLEGTLLAGGVCAKKVKKGRCYAFRMPPDFTCNLADAGFDFMNLANNHMNDFGHGGIIATIKALEDACIEYGGPYGKVGRFEIDSIRIAIVCFSTSPNTDVIFEIDKAQRIVAEQSRFNDLTIVSFHGGGEGLRFLHTKNSFEYFMGQPRGNVVRFAKAVVDSGADFVWGHGPHVPRAMELYKDRLIAYSLGNFCTRGFNLYDERGYAPILKVVLDSTGAFERGEIISVIQRTGKALAVDSLSRAAKLIEELSWEDFPDSAPLFTDNSIVLPGL